MVYSLYQQRSPDGLRIANELSHGKPDTLLLCNHHSTQLAANVSNSIRRGMKLERAAAEFSTDDVVCITFHITLNDIVGCLSTALCAALVTAFPPAEHHIVVRPLYCLFRKMCIARKAHRAFHELRAHKAIFTALHIAECRKSQQLVRGAYIIHVPGNELKKKTHIHPNTWSIWM